MTDTEWLRVGAEVGTKEEVAKMSDALSIDGCRFTPAHLLRVGLAIGLGQIKRDPSVLVPSRKRST